MGGGRLTIPSMGACRVKAKLPMPPLDNTRFRLEPPSLLKRNDYGEWKKAVDNAHSQLEHQYTRILNLELMLKYGDKVRGGGEQTHTCVCQAAVLHVDMHLLSASHKHACLDRVRCGEHRPSWMRPW